MNDHVRTAIRWRPGVENREISIEKVNENVISIGRQFRTYVVDHVFESTSTNGTQAEVYNVLVKPLIDRAFQGYDCTFLAIGQTGSGKTYTVGFDQSTNSEHNGMTARVLQSIFSYENAEQVKVLISFIEIYNEQAYDLLAENQQEPFYNKDNRFAEPTKKSIKMQDDVVAMLAQASNKRHIRKTNMNSASSRSHAVFTIYLGIKHAEMDIRESTINIIDLAGSEGFGKTGSIAGSDAQFEGKCINESLSALKRVINAMSSKQTHVPFRDSVMTTFLRKALNAQSYLTLLGCVSPYYDDNGETLSTVLFVSEAKQIKKTPQLNAVITEFQKSKTPVKAIFQTPNSITNSAVVFKRPLSMSIGISNKRPYSVSRTMSVPPKKLSFTANSNDLNRFDRNSILSNSTAKISNTIYRQKQSHSITAHTSKAVSNLFPIPLSPSRRLIENLLKTNKNTQSNEAINFCDASTPSASSVAMEPISYPPSSDEIQMHVGKIANLLAGPALQMVSSEVEKRIAENPNHKSMPGQIMESFYAVLKKLFTQDAPQQSLSVQNHLELSPLVEKTDSNEMAVASSSTRVESPMNVVPLFEGQTPKVVVHVNHADKQINVEVLPTPGRSLPSSLLSSPSLDSHSSENASQIVNITKSELDHVNYSVQECQNLIVKTEQLQALNQSIEELFNQKATNLEIDKIIDESYETQLNDSMMVQLTPIAKKRITAELERTPIGIIRLRRKITPMNVDMPNTTIDDNNTAYEIVMVNKNRPAPLQEIQFNSVQAITNAITGIIVDVKATNVLGKSYPLPKSDAIASKMTANEQRFPIAPSMIFERLNKLQEYSNRMISMQNAANVAPDHKLGRPQNSRKRTNVKNVLPVQATFKPSNIAEYIFNILNTGTQNDLTKLVMIGPITAAQIFNNRQMYGRFECIDALLRMPSWSQKKHQRFLKLNISS